MNDILKIILAIQSASGEELTPVQKAMVIANVCVNPNDDNKGSIVALCQSRNITFSSVVQLSKLFHFDGELIQKVLNELEGTRPQDLAQITDVNSLYSLVNSYVRVQGYSDVRSQNMGGR